MFMNFKKYLISISICWVFILVFIGSLFVPLKTYAYSVNDIKKNSDFCAIIDNYFSGSNYTYNLIAISDETSYFSITLIKCNNIDWLSDTVLKYWYGTSVIYKDDFSYLGTNSYSSNANYVRNCVSVTDYTDFNVPNTDFAQYFFGDDDSFLDKLSNCNDKVKESLSKIKEFWQDTVSLLLGLSESDLNGILSEIYNDDYSNEIFTAIDGGTLKQIQKTANNLKKFVSGNILYNSDTDTYSIKGYYPDNNIYPLWYDNDTYYYDYIYYSNEIDLTAIIQYLQNIYFIVADIDTQLVAFVADFNAFVGGLGGLIAGAIGVAWADIKGELSLMIDDINLNFGDVTIGDSSISDDDTTNKIKIDFDSLVDKINLKLSGLFDDLKINLDDLFSDIHVVVDNDTIIPDTPIQEDNDFWVQLKNIIVSKIPLFGQCVELFESVIDVCIDDIDTVDLIPETHGLLLSQQYGFVSVGISNDGQLEFDTPVVFTLFDGLVAIKQSADNSVFGVGVSFDVDYYGYTFNGFYFDISYYYNNYRNKLSNFLLFMCYMMFAWSVIHRTSKLFGHSSSDSGG